jgi:adenylate cyclase
MKILLSPIWAIITTALLTWLTLANPTFLQNVELKLFDQMIVQEPVKNTDAVLVDISEKTLDKYGQFPFPRDTYADIITRLRESNAGVIVLNLSFPEEDRTGKDSKFIEVLPQGVVLAHFPSEKTEGRAAYTTGMVEVGQPASYFVPKYKGIAANLPQYEAAASGIGIANTLPEIDGVVRRLPMVSAVDDKLYPSIVLEVFKTYMATNTYQIKSSDFGVEAVRVKGFDTIKTDPLSRIWVNPNFTFQRYDAADNFPDLMGATVFIGVTAEGISNPVPTAAGAAYGHDVVAKAFASVTSGYNIVTPMESELYKLAAIIGLGLVIVLSSYIRFGWALPIALVVGAIAYPFYLFASSSVLINTAIPALMSILVFAHVYGVKYGQEYFAKMQIKKQFGTYLSPAMVEKLQKNPDLLKLGGETRELSIMFTDVRGFTTISEHYGENVQGLTQIMNRYMTAMTAKILENEGTLDKYIGDAQMAFWNAPLDDSQHAKNAVRTALAMLEDLEKFNEEIAKEGVPAFGMGLGINTANVVVGNMGSSQRFDYTCLGDGVNLASRLEGQSKPYGVKMILGPVTAQQVRDEFDVCELDRIAVKGKTVGVKIYTIHAQTEEHSAFLRSYYDGNWTTAIFHLEKARAVSPGLNGYYDAMYDRIKSGKAPSNWDGTYRSNSK